MKNFVKVFGLIIPTLIVTQVAWSSPPPDPQAYWSKTNTNFEFLEQVILSKCQDSVEELLGCISAVNVLAAKLDPPLEMGFSLEGVRGNPFLGPLYKEFGHVAFFNSKAQALGKISPLVYERSLKTEKNIRLKEALSYLAEVHAWPIPFGLIVESIISKIIYASGEGEALIAGQAWNAYLQNVYDPHMHAVPHALLEAMDNSADVEFGGIGATINSLGKELLVTSLVKDSAGEAVGLKRNDVIASIGGVDATGMSIEDAVLKLRGPVGSSVSLQVFREGQTIDYDIVRSVVKVKNIQGEIINDFGVPVAYLKIATFEDNDLCAKTKTELHRLLNLNPKAMVLDLRQNSGGLMREAGCVASLFLGKERLIFAKKFLDTGKVDDFFGPEEKIIDLPLVTLIDSSTASASEMIASAFQDYEIGWISGDRSFGKGTMQTEVLSDSQEFVFMQTDSILLSPQNRSHQLRGVSPNFYSEPRPYSTAEERFSVRESDKYNNALDTIGDPWTETRKPEANRIYSCLANGLAGKIFAKNIKASVAPDYRLLAAEETLKCWQNW